MSGPSKVALDVAQMKKIGLYHIPTEARIHLDAAEKLAKIAYERPRLFNTPASGESGAKSISYGKWLELYTLAQTILENTVKNFNDTATGLVNTAEEFADTDMTNAEKLEAEAEMDLYENGDTEYQESGGERGEAGFGPPPDPAGDAPEPNDVPSSEGTYRGSDS